MWHSNYWDAREKIDRTIAELSSCIDDCKSSIAELRKARSHRTYIQPIPGGRPSRL